MKWLIILMVLTVLFIGFKMWQQRKEMARNREAKERYERIMKEGNDNAMRICNDAITLHPSIGCTCPEGMGHKVTPDRE